MQPQAMGMMATESYVFWAIAGPRPPSPNLLHLEQEAKVSIHPRCQPAGNMADAWNASELLRLAMTPAEAKTTAKRLVCSVRHI